MTALPEVKPPWPAQRPTAFAGFYCAYVYDLPLGPAEVAVASAVLVLVGAATVVVRIVRTWRVR